MQPRPLYRWKSFWLGLCVLVGLSWAWVDSVSYVSGVMWNSATGYRTSLENTDGILGFFHYHLHGAEPTGLAVARFATNAEYATPRALVLHTESVEVGLGFTVGYWLLILLFLVRWTASLAWRWRRMRRVAVPPMD